MEQDIKSILRGITAIYKQLEEIKVKLAEPPIIINEAPKSYSGKSYGSKFISDKQLNFLKVLIAKHPDSNYTNKVLDKYEVKELKDLYSKEAGELITELKGTNGK